MDSKKSNIIIIAIIIVVSLAVGGGAFFYYYNLPENRLIRTMDLVHEYLANEQWEEAKVQLKAAISIDPNNAEAYLLLADIYIREEQYGDAIECYEKVIELEADNPEPYLAISNIYCGEEEYAKALDILQKGLDNTGSQKIKDEIGRIQGIIDEIAAKKAEEERLRKEREAAEKFDKTREEYIQKYGWGYNVGQMMPDCDLKTLSGGTAKISDFLRKPLYINLFTTWCPYCDMEVGDMQATYNKYSGEIEYIMIDLAESAADAKQYATDFGLSIPMYLRDDWTLGSYQVDGVPTTFVLDKYGRIVDMTIGWAQNTWITNATKNAIAQSKD